MSGGSPWPGISSLPGVERIREESVIIGAGIHGVSTALALASRGRRSLILEAAASPFQGASVRNEGKLHLGFVYALDRSGETTRAMVEGSLAFAPLIERWCGPVDWESMRSDEFGYVVMGNGLVDPDQAEAHYESVLAEIEKVAVSLGSNYAGVDLGDAAIRRHNGVFPGMADGHSNCWFETPERAIDPRVLATRIVDAAADEPLIEIRSGHRVVQAERLESGFALEVETGSGRCAVETENVVNCAWDGRSALDQMVVEDLPAPNFRVKHHVIVRGGDTTGIVPATLAQGPFGDLVLWPNDDVYISWYPVARTHFGDRPEGDLRPDRRLADQVHEVIQGMFPALAGFSLADYGPCFIVADGQTDINDPASRLHTRVGAEHSEFQGWYSIRSTKLTTAPLAAERCAAAITGIGAEL